MGTGCGCPRQMLRPQPRGRKLRGGEAGGEAVGVVQVTGLPRATTEAVVINSHFTHKEAEAELTSLAQMPGF